ncbi:TIGR04141 family sporadically distributed protein [Actinocorallia lasiicapitis]
MPASTREVTIYRMSGTPQLDDILETLDGTYLTEPGWNLEVPDYPDGAEALVFHRGTPPTKVPWLDEATLLTGPLPDYETQDAAVVLLLSVDHDIYAITFGTGFRSVPDRFKDQTFGLSFAIRAVDAEEVSAVARKAIDTSGRQDETRALNGMAFSRIDVSEYNELVRTLAGKVDPALLGLGAGKPVAVNGATGLRMRVPLGRAELVALLRRISEVRRRQVPEEFAFIEAIRPVRDEQELARLDARLADGLAGDPSVPITATLPLDLVKWRDEAQSYVIKIGPVAMSPRADLDLEDILRRCRVMHTIPPVEALRRGDVRVCADTAGQKQLAHASAIRFLDASVRENGREFFLLDGAWYEGGTEFFTSIRRTVNRVIKPVPSVPLPPWEPTATATVAGKKQPGEPTYNAVTAAQSQGRLVCLDAKLLRTALNTGKNGRGFEICDLLGPDNELICVKKGKDAVPFSHLFFQPIVGLQALLTQEKLRKEFIKLVSEHTGRALPEDYRPKKVIFGVMVDASYELSADRLFPFSQVALAHTVHTLEGLGLEVEVVPIRRGGRHVASAV